MLKLTQILPDEVIKALAKHNFQLVGPWKKYYLLRGNALLIRELPLKITFRGRDKRVIEELRPHIGQIVRGKGKVAMKLRNGRHWLVLEFEE